MRITIATTLGLGMAGLLAGLAPVSAADQPSSARSAHRVTWESCPATQRELSEAGAQCAKVTVPLDYARPNGRTIQIAISRIGAKVPAQRRGILLSNPGGPGGPGLASTLALRPALADVADRYDLIGFDPRFLGESHPIDCGPAPWLVEPGPTTTPRKDFDDSTRSARAIARRCHEHEDNAALLPHASTRNVARDMDAIRAALGEEKLSYFGVSYGADLGAVFTQLFPGRADRIVIDSSTDPAATQYELFQRAGQPLEQALDEWSAWAARHDPEYRLGRSAVEVRATVQRLLAHAERTPIVVDGYRISAWVMRLVLRQPIQHQEYDPMLAALVRDLVAAGAGRLDKPGPELTAMLNLLRSPALQDSLIGGAIFMCGDGGWPAGGWPKNPETYWRNMQRSRADQPLFGPLVNSMMAPCAFWKSEPREPGTTIRNDVPVLMLQARGDTNVPYDGALALHRRLTGSRLVTAEIRAHGVYGRAVDGLTPVPCADQAVIDYLRGAPLPTADFTCSP